MDLDMTRDILDKDDNIIGELTLPDDTPEEVWTTQLALYKYDPAANPFDEDEGFG